MFSANLDLLLDAINSNPQTAVQVWLDLLSMESQEISKSLITTYETGYYSLVGCLELIPDFSNHQPDEQKTKLVIAMTSASIKYQIAYGCFPSLSFCLTKTGALVVVPVELTYD